MQNPVTSTEDTGSTNSNNTPGGDTTSGGQGKASAKQSSAPDLTSASDTGVSDSDNLTSIKTPTLVGTAEAGTTVTLYDDHHKIVVGTAVTDATGHWSITTIPLADGEHTLTAKVKNTTDNGPDPDGSNGNGVQGPKTITITIDSAAPVAPGPADLTAATDSGRSSTDNITYFTKPTFTGTAPAGVTVTLYAGSTKLGAGVANRDGIWTITSTVTMAQGVHDVVATTVDAAGNMARAPGLLVTIDTEVPPPGLPDLLATSDSGRASTDNITRIAAPELSGTAEAIAIVHVYDGERLLGTTMADAAGNWRINSPLLLDGVHNISATATDVAGNVSLRSQVLPITVDTVAPAAPVLLDLAPASDSGASDQDNITNTTTPVIKGKAEANAIVNIYDGQTLVGTGLADASGAWTITTSVLSNGIHNLTATATDVAGNVSPPSALLPVTVDTVAPAAPVTLDLATPSDSGRSGIDDITNINTPVITGKAEAGSTVSLYDGTTKIGTALTNAAGVWTVTTPLLADGVHILTATAVDVAGNASLPSAPLPVTIDTVPPAAPADLDLATASDSGISNSDDITNINKPVITGTAEANAIVILYEGETKIGTALANAAGVWTITATTLSDGVHNLSATATDVAGNVSPRSAPLAVTIDTVPPAAPIALDLIAPADTGSSNIDNVTNATTPVITGQAEPGSTVDLYDGQSKIGSAVTDATGVWTITTSALSNGIHNLTATATDVAGNVSPPSALLPVTVDTVAPAAPVTLDLATPSDSGRSGIDDITNINTPVITGKAEAGSTVSLYDGTTKIGTALTNAAGVWTVTTPLLADGVHILTATAVDVAGNVSLPSEPLPVTIDTVPPAAPADLDLATASDSGISNSDDITNINKPVITGTAEANAIVILYEGETKIGTALANAAGVWTITATTLSDGVHNLSATATDVAGNVSPRSASLAVTIDTVPPAAPIALDLIAPADTGSSNTDNVTNATTPVITGQAEPGSTVDLYDGQSKIGSAVTDATGVWTITTSALSNGIHNLTATATDVAGNVSPPSALLPVTVDTVAPAAPVTLDLATPSDSGRSGIDDITNINTPVITGKAEAGSTVSLYDGTTKIGTALTNAAGVWTVTTPLLADGVHILTATAVDVAGNVSLPSEPLPVTIDTVPPAAPADLDLAAASDSGISNSDDITNINKPVISGKAEANAIINLYEGQTQVGTAVANASGVWSITTSTLSDGVHSLTATATDVAGNVSALSTALVLTIDTTPPRQHHAPNLDPASDDGVPNDNITGSLTPTIECHTEPGALVTLYDGDTIVGTTIADTHGEWTITTALTPGLHSLKSTSADAAGNVSAPSAALNITVAPKPAAPSAPVFAPGSDTGPSATDNVTGNATPVLTGTATPGTTITIYDGGNTPCGTGVTGADGIWTVTCSPLGQGGHTLTAICTSPSGYASDPSGGLVCTVDTLSPVVTGSGGCTPGSDTGPSATDNITSNPMPTLTGTGEPGTHITIYEGGTPVGGSIVSVTGTWEVICGYPFPDGVHHLTATATDPAGNVSAPRALPPLTIDTSIATPAAPQLSPDSDTGSSTTDGITSDTTPTFSGTTEPGSTIVLYSGTTIIGTTIASGTATDNNGGCTWTITPATPLQLGTHPVTAVITDLAGNTTQTTICEIVIGLAPVAPSTPDLAAASDSGVSSTDNITSVTLPVFTGTAAAGASVTLYEGATARGTGVANESGAWSITANGPLSQGVHSLAAIVTNNVGTSPLSGAVTVTIDSTAPAAPGAPDLAAASDNGSSNTDNATTVTTPVITGSAEAGAIVTLYEGATVLGTAIANGSGAWSITSAALGLGAHTLSATAKDAAGNISAASAGLAVVIAQMPSAPGTPDLAAASDSGVSNADNLTNVTLPVFSGTAEAGTTVTLLEGATVRGTGIADGTGTWTITANAALAQGSHVLTASATNLIGTSAVSGNLSVTIDTTAPTAPLAPDLTSDSGSSSADNLTNVNRPSFAGTTEAFASVALYEGATLLGTATADNLGAWTITTVPQLGDGIHAVTVTATDRAGNTSTLSPALSVTIDTVAPAPSAPDMAAASDTGTSNTDNFTTITAPVFTGTAQANAVVQLREGATVLGTTTASGTGTWSITSSALSMGAHNLTAVAIDSAGNTSAASGILPVVISVLPAAPSAPDLLSSSDSGISGTDNITNDTTPSLTGTSLPNATVTLYEGATILGTTTADGTGAWTITSAALSQASHTLTAKATNGIGTSAASTAISVVIDTATVTPAALDLTSASDTGTSTTDNITSITTPTFTGTAEALSSIILYEGSTAWGSAVANASGVWTLTTSPMGDGTHSLTAVATDVAGNVSAASTALAVTIDHSTPAASSVPDLMDAFDTGASNSDNLSNRAQLTGIAEAGSRITLYANGVAQPATITTNGAGVWVAGYAPTADGVVDFSVTVTDPVGNVSPMSGTLAVTFDRTAPVATPINLSAASDHGVSNTDKLTNDGTPTLFGYIDPGASITLTEYYQFAPNNDGFKTLGTTTADSNGYWEITTANLSNYTLRKNIGVTITDLAGNITTMGQSFFNMWYDSMAPAINLIQLDNSSNSGNASDNITNITAPVMLSRTVIQAEDYALGNPAVVVTLYEGDTVLGTSVHSNYITVNGVIMEVNLTSLPVLSEGTHIITGRAVDRAGNVSTLGTSTIVIDTIALAPAAPDLVTAYDSGASNTDNVTIVATPMFTGTAEPGAVVKLYDGATLVGTGTATAAGVWSIQSTALALGVHSITAVQTDAALNVSAASAPLQVTIGATATAPSAPDLAAASDSGISNTDNRTNITTPTLTGTAEAGATVVLYEGAINLGSTTADAAGAWSITSAPLSHATHSLTAKATNLIGTSVASATLSVVIDTAATAPGTPDLATASDNGVSTTDNITNVTTPVITGSGEAGASVTLFDGATALGSATIAANGTWSITSTPLSAGAHSLSAVATDTAGNVSAPSAALTVTIDTSTPIPSSTPDLLDASDKGASNTDNLTSSTGANLTGVTEAGARVTLYVNGAPQPVITANAAGVWNYSYTASTSGVVNFSASVADASGNVASMSDTLAVTFDLAKPLVPVVNLATASDWGLSNSDKFTSDPTPTFYGTTEPFAVLTFTCLVQEPIPNQQPLIRTLVLGTVTADANGYWELTSPSLAGFSTVSSKFINCQITDVAGNVTTQTGTAGAMFGIDTYKPTASTFLFATGSDSGVVGDGTTNVTAPAFTGAVTLNTDDLWNTSSGLGTVVLYDGATVIGTAPLTSSYTAGTVVNTRYTVTSEALTEGVHTLTLKAFDAAGNESLPLTQTVVIDTVALAPSVPDMLAASDNGTSNSDNITTAKSQTYTGVGEPGGTVRLYDGGTLLAGTAAIDGAGNWSLSVNVTAVGVHAITAVQTDKAGNLSVPSGALQVAIGNVPVAPSTPDLDAASDTGISGTDNLTKDTTPTLSGTAEPDSIVTLFEGAVSLGTATTSPAGIWNITTSALGQGTHSLVAKASTMFGTSVTSAALAVVIDTSTVTPASLDLAAISDNGTSNSDNRTSIRTPVITGTAEAGSTVALYEGSIVWGTAIAAANGVWSITTAELGLGAHSLTAQAVDVAGNVSAMSSGLDITIVLIGQA